MHILDICDFVVDTLKAATLPAGPTNIQWVAKPAPDLESLQVRKPLILVHPGPQTEINLDRARNIEGNYTVIATLYARVQHTERKEIEPLLDTLTKIGHLLLQADTTAEQFDCTEAKTTVPVGWSAEDANVYIGMIELTFEGAHE